MYAVRSIARITPLLSAGLSIVFALGAVATPLRAQKGALREAVARVRDTRLPEELDDGADDVVRISVPPNVKVQRDVVYGPDSKHRFDAYIPARASNAAVIFLVHGGGWRTGDKASRAVVENKVARWTRAGFIVISANYRLLPESDPLEQAGDVARAVSVAQQRLPEWGGEPDHIVLVGHSAGAHLAALLATDQTILGHQGARPVLGTIILDSPVLDVEQLMKTPHLPLYDPAFGVRPRYWRAASPFRMLGAGAAPFLLVCSTLRKESCPEATKFVKRAKQLGVTAQLIQQPLSHRQINEQLGAPGAYTTGVDGFLQTLDYSLARALRN
jgi:arylformamidase